MNKYEIRTNNKKNSIINATIEIISKKGYNNTSIKEIATKAMVSQVSIYNYFENKENLAIEAIKTILVDSFNKARRLIKINVPFEEKVKLSLEECQKNAASNLMKYFNEIYNSDENLSKLIDTSIRDLKRQLYIDYIEEGKRVGAIDIAVPSSTIVKYLEAVDSIKYDKNDRGEELKYLHQLALYGILKR